MEVEADGKETGLVLLKQGAEARVFESAFVGRRCIIKERFSKKYRHPTLDSKLTLKRLNAEARCMTKARKLGVPTPVLFSVDHLLHTLTFEFIEGPMVKEVLLEFGTTGIVEESLQNIATQIGDKIAKLHDGGLTHGDLTTSNMLIKKDTNQLELATRAIKYSRVKQLRQQQATTTHTWPLISLLCRVISTSTRQIISCHHGQLIKHSCEHQKVLGSQVKFSLQSIEKPA
ncbi:uncharacterized protein LOC141646937 isoform X2 [Silene latifolia]|uniref:uncharacterized protein LOC141646937 isoform X2 n=1 Tax=Silene latifolia TaxID=37657 RepID=UPI003D7835BE